MKAEKKIQQYDRKSTRYVYCIELGGGLIATYISSFIIIIIRTHNQRWGYRDGFIYSRADPRIVLDIKGDDEDEGTKVMTSKRKLEDNANQQWILEPVD